MRTLRVGFFFSTSLVVLGSILACGGGIPIRLRIDEVDPLSFSIDEAMSGIESEIVSQGFLPGELRGLPEEWPKSLPHIRYEYKLDTPPQQIDLTPDDEGNAKKYKQINEVSDAIERIEINDLVLRLEHNTTTVATPELRLEIARDKDAAVEDRSAWEPIGYMPSAKAGAVTDLRLTLYPGGETLFNLEVGDEEKELAVRISGTLVYDTEENPKLPAGAAQIRIIAVVTFFVDPAALHDAIPY